MSPIVKALSNKISPINPQIFDCQNKSNMRRCDRKCVLSVILRQLSVNIIATKYVIFYRIL